MHFKVAVRISKQVVPSMFSGQTSTCNNHRTSHAVSNGMCTNTVSQVAVERSIVGARIHVYTDHCTCAVLISQPL